VSSPLPLPSFSDRLPQLFLSGLPYPGKQIGIETPIVSSDGFAVFLGFFFLLFFWGVCFFFFFFFWFFVSVEVVEGVFWGSWGFFLGGVV